MERTGEFRFSGIVWHEIGMRTILLCNELQDLLNQALKIKDYGEVLDWILLIYIVAPQTIHEPCKIYSRKHKNLYVQHRLDYEKFLHATDEEAREMMALSFLEVLQQFPKWRIWRFDWRRLYADAEKLFLEKGLINNITKIYSLPI